MGRVRKLKVMNSSSKSLIVSRDYLDNFSYILLSLNFFDKNFVSGVLLSLQRLILILRIF